MTEPHAVQFVESKRQELEIDPEMNFESAEKAIVEYKSNPDQPGPTEDRIAWIIKFSSAWASVQVYVDDRKEKVLKVKRTR